MSGDAGDAQRSRWPRVALALLGLGLVAGFAWLVVRAQALPTGVVPIVWDREVCAHCKMHIGEPGFAAQLQLEDGQVLNFDDPGCLFRHLSRDIGPVRATYFRHVHEDRWLSAAEVGFIEVEPTPMGFGLGAVDAAHPGAMPYAAARARLLGDSEARP